jgi:DNA-binding beta-propeller fold protein YncE
MALLLICAASAPAEVRYDQTGSFGPKGGEAGQFAPPGRIAVDQDSGLVLVIDRGFEWGTAPRVEVFSASEGAATYLTEFGSGTLVQPEGIAVDPSSGSVYVADAGAEEIFEFDSDGAPTPTFSLDASFSSPAAGSGDGELGSFAAALAFDATSDRLLVADPGNNRIDRFEPDGTFESAFDGSDSGTAFTSLKDLAVGPSGDLYVVDGGRVERFEADGNHISSVTGLPGEPDRVAYNPLSEEVLVGHSGSGFEAAVYQVDAQTGQFTGSFREEAPSWWGTIAGLATTPAGRLYMAASSFAGEGVLVFAARILPELTIGQPSAVTATSAHLSGTVNPSGQPATSWHFEYSQDGSSWTSTPDVGAGEGEAPEPVEADLADLEPNTAYQVRLVASNGNGTATSAAQELSTGVVSPATVTGLVTDRTGDGATLRGNVNPFGLFTTYHFEYGTTAAYGSRVPVGDELYAGSGRVPKHVFARVTDLQPGTTYHYRLVAENSAGQSFGSDETFLSRPASTTSRAYEMVSPVNKGDANVDIFRLSMASPDGNRFAFITKSPISAEGVSNQAPLFPQYLATRSSAGWSTIALDPPTLSTPGIGFATYATLGISEDGSHAVVVSARKLAPGGSEGDSNLYLFETATGAYQTLATVPGITFHDFARFDQSAGSRIVVGGTSDYSKIVLYGDFGASFLAGAPPGGLYEWSEGNLRLASLDANGDPLPNVYAGSGGDRVPRYLSADGSRVFFRAGDGRFYARVNGSETVSVSAPNAIWANASKDGRFVFTRGAGTEILTRYDFETGGLEELTGGVIEEGSNLLVSEDGSYVYFFKNGLAPGETIAGKNIYVWHDGQVEYVAALGEEGLGKVQRMISPSGRYLAFSAYANPTGYDNSSQACKNVNVESDPPEGACRQIYRYDAVTEELTCASCRRDGGHPTGNTFISESSGVQIVNHHFPRSVLDDGNVIFDTPDPLSEEDVNSKRDVYAFDGEEPALISAGTGPGDSTFLDATPDGKNIFFVTEDQLVGLDKDTQADAYDARIGGGISAQNPPPLPPVCIGSACRSEATAPGLSTPSTEASSGRGNVKPRANRRCPKGRQKRKVKGKVRCVKPSRHNHGRKHR